MPCHEDGGALFFLLLLLVIFVIRFERGDHLGGVSEMVGLQAGGNEPHGKQDVPEHPSDILRREELPYNSIKADDKTGYSAILFVALHSPTCHECADGGESQYLVERFVKSSTADKDRADGIDEIVHRIDVGCDIGPVGH